MQRAAVLSIAALALAGCGSDDAPQRSGVKGSAATSRQGAPAAQAPAEPGARAIEHLRAIDRLTAEAGGDRQASTPGDTALVEYAADHLRAAGYAVRFEEARFPFYDQATGPRITLAGQRVGTGRAVETLEFSPGGTVGGRLTVVAYDRADSGCRPADYARVDRGAVVLVKRGVCRFTRKAKLAASAGAAALIVGDPTARNATQATLGSPEASKIPVVATSAAIGRRLRAASGREVEVRVDAVSERRTVRSVIAEHPAAAGAAGVVMAGAHVDSVDRAPGLNDNATGVSAVLAAAEALADDRVPLRIGLWSAEEQGLYGSRDYVKGLTRAQRRAIRAYVNLDMVGSPNGATLVYGRGRLRERLRDALRATGAKTDVTDIGDGSDHAPFEDAGVPAGGIYTGSDERKTPERARRFGGRAGRPYDPCYHRPCDKLDNVDLDGVRTAARALVGALPRLAR